MRHGVGYRKFQKSTAHTRALFRNLATSLLLHENVETTLQKAKELRPIVEKLITIGRTDDLTSRRTAYNYLMDKKAVHKLFTDVGPRFKERNGGYTRVIRTRVRPGDCAAMACISLVVGPTPVAKDAKSAVDEPKTEKKAKATKEKAAPKAKKTAKEKKPE